MLLFASSMLQAEIRTPQKPIRLHESTQTFPILCLIYIHTYCMILNASLYNITRLWLPFTKHQDFPTLRQTVVSPNLYYFKVLLIWLLCTTCDQIKKIKATTLSQNKNYQKTTVNSIQPRKVRNIYMYIENLFHIRTLDRL